MARDRIAALSFPMEDSIHVGSISPVILDRGPRTAPIPDSTASTEISTTCRSVSTAVFTGAFGVLVEYNSIRDPELSGRKLSAAKGWDGDS